MKTLSKHEQPAEENANQPAVPFFAYELMRDILIPELLGNDTSEISYWAGKHIARKFPLLSLEEITAFFHEAGWGQLHIVHEKKHECKLELSGELVERRLHMMSAPCFRIEAGFIAEQIRSMKEVTAEAIEELHKRQGKVTVTVRWDSKDMSVD